MIFPMSTGINWTSYSRGNTRPRLGTMHGSNRVGQRDIGYASRDPGHTTNKGKLVYRLERQQG